MVAYKSVGMPATVVLHRSTRNMGAEAVNTHATSKQVHVQPWAWLCVLQCKIPMRKINVAVGGQLQA